MFRLLLWFFNHEDFFIFFLSPTVALSHVNGHGAKHNKSDSTSEQEAAEGSSGEMQKENKAMSQKPTRRPTNTQVRKKKIMSDEEEKATELKNERLKPPISSDEKDKDRRSQKHSHQNGKNVEEANLKYSNKKSKVSPSKSQDKQKSASTDKLDGAESEELFDSPKRSSPRKRRQKREERGHVESNHSSDEFEAQAKSRMPTRNKSKSKRLQEDTSASESSEQEYKPKRNLKRKRSTGSSDEEMDNSDNTSSRRLSLRALPKKKYISENSLSEEDSASVSQGKQRNGNRTASVSKEDRNKRSKSNRTSSSEAKNRVSSKRKCIYTSDSEEEGGEKETVLKNNKSSCSNSSKRLKRESKQEDSNIQKGNMSPKSDSTEDEDDDDCSRSRKKGLRQTKQKRKDSDSSSNTSSDSESEHSSSASEILFASSGSHSSPKRRSSRWSGIGERTATRQLRQRRRRSASEEDASDESYNKPHRKTCVNTRNRGKRTVNYQDSE